MREGGQMQTIVAESLQDLYKIFDNRIIKPSPDGKFQDCWYWTGVCFSSGYGAYYFDGKVLRIHRFAAHLWLGFDLDSKSLVCHKCDNPKCFNPEHLFIGTSLDNMQDKKNKGRCSRLSNELNPMCKISNKFVSEIRDLFENKIYKQCELMRIYGISRVQVCRIVNYNQR